jgi:hypothetical protein
MPKLPRLTAREIAAVLDLELRSTLRKQTAID